MRKKFIKYTIELLEEKRLGICGNCPLRKNNLDNTFPELEFSFMCNNKLKKDLKKYFDIKLHYKHSCVELQNDLYNYCIEHDK